MSEHATTDDILTRVRGHLAANRTGGFFTRDEMAAVVRQLDAGEAERDRFRAAFDREDLARREAQRQAQLLGAERDRLASERAALERQVRSLTTENDRLHEDVADVNESLNGAMADAAYGKALQAERDRLAGRVQRALALHTPVRSSAVDKQVCRCDQFNWPCETVRGLTDAAAPAADRHGRANDLIRRVVETTDG